MQAFCCWKVECWETAAWPQQHCTENILAEAVPFCFTGGSSFQSQPKGKTFIRGWIKWECDSGLAHLSIRKLTGCWFQTIFLMRYIQKMGGKNSPFFRSLGKFSSQARTNQATPLPQAFFPKGKMLFHNLTKHSAPLQVFYHQLLSGIKSLWKYFWFKV